MGSRRSRQRPDKREIAAELQRSDEAAPLSELMRAYAFLLGSLDDAGRAAVDAFYPRADEAAQEIEAKNER